MKVALYARVSTERQAERGTIGSQLEVLREHVTAGGDELAGEYVDDGQSGARLDRPGLDALRDAAEAGLFELVWCLSPDRLARAYAYQVLVLDELARFGVTVRFTDAPDLAAGDPQATLLTQVQGVIAEYEKAKIAERYRRGKLFRARAGEITTWKTALRLPARRPQPAASRRTWRSTNPKPRWCGASSPTGPRASRSARSAGGSTPTAVPSPTGKRDLGALHPVPAAAQRGLHRPGLLQPHRDHRRPAARPGAPGRSRARARTGSRSAAPASSPTSSSRPPAASPTTTPSGARAAPNPAPGCSRAWSSAGSATSAPTATRCAAATAPGTATTTAATTTRCAPAAKTAAAPNATSAPTRSTSTSSARSAPRSPSPRCCWPASRPSRSRTPIPDDELLAAELARLDRKIDAATAERRRLADLYQAGLIDLPELQRRSTRSHRTAARPANQTRHPRRRADRARPRQPAPPPRHRLRPADPRSHRPARPPPKAAAAATAHRRRPRHRLARQDPAADPPRPARPRPDPPRTEASRAIADQTTGRVKPRPFAFRWCRPPAIPTASPRP